jgi:hypothetical protein
MRKNHLEEQEGGKTANTNVVLIFQKLFYFCIVYTVTTTIGYTVFRLSCSYDKLCVKI